MEDVLQRAMDFAGIEYVIWAEQNAMVRRWNPMSYCAEAGP
jgi:hypothetical protein